MLKRFLAYYKPHKKLLALDMTASLLVSLIGIVYPIVTRTMLNDLIPNKKYQLIATYGALLLFIYLIRMWLRYFIQYRGHVMGVHMQAQMRSDMFNHLETLPFSFYDENETGGIMSRMTNDLFDISELAHHGPENIIISIMSMLVSFVYLSTINLKLTLIIFFCLPFMILVAMLLNKKMKKAFRDSKVFVAKINASLEGSISGIRVTKAFTNSQKESEKFEEGNKAFVASRTEAYKTMGQFHSSTQFITDVFNVIVLIAGGLYLYDGRITFADYSAYVVSVNLFLTPLNTLISFMEQFQNGVTGFERFIEIMDSDSEKDAPDAVSVGRVKGNIKFDNVVCGYGEDDDVLKGVSLEIKEGETFALVGPSGGGKTTICHLIPHFYGIRSGKISLDDIDISGIKMESLRKNIGIVQQDVYLFNASIRENILYGKPDAGDEEVEKAAKLANIHDFIMNLPNGYDTQIGERGVRLSGGQKQRLSIARVFLKNPPILILDEATSALDTATEVLIQNSLDELCKGRTTLVVAHRLSTVRNADKIAVISDGRVFEQGSHDELMTLNGKYADLYKRQFVTEGM